MAIQDESWHAAIPFRAKLEKCIVDRFNVPNVTIVVQGGAGTFMQVRELIAIVGAPTALTSEGHIRQRKAEGLQLRLRCRCL